jgi:hypothetical protein
MNPLGETAAMHDQTDHTDQPETDGSAGHETVASRVGSGDSDRSGVSPDFSAHLEPDVVAMLSAAPTGAIVVWADHRLSAAKQIAAGIRRRDLKFVTPRQVGNAALRGKITRQILVHPRARLTLLQAKEIDAAQAYIARINKPKPSYAPVYAAALYPELAVIAREHGYALAVHGSLQRDLDLIAVPWVENPKTSRELVAAILANFCVKQKGEPDTVWHGRERWLLSVGFGECAIDLQFVPVQPRSNP